MNDEERSTTETLPASDSLRIPNIRGWRDADGNLCPGCGNRYRSPLRRVTGKYKHPTLGWHETLECGHYLIPHPVAYYVAGVLHRRCRYCRRTKDRIPPDTEIHDEAAKDETKVVVKRASA